MFVILLILTFIRPFISSLAYPHLNFIYSLLLLSFLALWIITKGIHLDKLKPTRKSPSAMTFSDFRSGMGKCFTCARKGILSCTIKYPLMLFILAIFISLIFSQDKITSIRELYKYLTGVLLLLAAASLADKGRNRIILCIVASGVLISILAIYQYFFGFQRLLGYITQQGISDPFILDYVSRKRVFFPFVTPNILGGYLAMLIPLTLTYKNRIWFIIPLSFALLLTRSLGGLLSLFLGLVVYSYLRGKFEKRKIIFIFGLLIIIVLVLILRSATQKQHIQPIFSAIMRLNYWQDTLRIIKAHLLTGVGLGNFNLTYSRYAHNSYLQLWAEMGILGIISILWLIIAGFKSTLRNLYGSPNRNQIICLLTASAVFLIHNLVDFTFFLPEVSLIWWVILGVALDYLCF